MLDAPPNTQRLRVKSHGAASIEPHRWQEDGRHRQGAVLRIPISGHRPWLGLYDFKSNSHLE